MFALCFLLALVLGGLTLAMAAVYRPALAVPVVSVLGVAIAVVWFKRARRPRAMPDRSATLATMVVVAFALAITAQNARQSVEHLSIDRDPGVYLVTGWWLADEGGILVNTDRAFFGDIDGLDHDSGGFYSGAPDGRLYPQFLHSLPVVLAAGHWVGGPWLMIKTNALLGGLALLCFFAFASRLVRPWLAGAATVALGVNVAQVFFTRDSYSEVLSQIFLFGGLAACIDAERERSTRRAFVAGLLLGATCMTRIDAIVLLTPLVAYLFIGLWKAASLANDEARERRRFLGALALGSALPVAIGALDATLFTPRYLSDLGEQVGNAAFALAATVVVGTTALLLQRRLSAVTSVARRLRRPLGTTAAIVVLVLAAFLSFVRPHLDYVTEATSSQSALAVEVLQAADRLPIDGSRTYAESSFQWLSWYVGPVALLLGVIGAAWVVRSLFLGRREELTLFLLLWAALTLLYLWRPSISPNHVWAMRRFLPLTTPGVLLMAVLLLDHVLDAPRRWKRARAASVATALAGIVVVPLSQLAPLWAMTDHNGMLATTNELCRRLGLNAAVLIEDKAALPSRFPVTIRAVCNIPVAVADLDADPNLLPQVRDLARAQGRELVVITSEDPPLGPDGIHRPGVEFLVDITFPRLEQTLSRRPTRTLVGGFRVFRLPLETLIATDQG